MQGAQENFQKALRLHERIRVWQRGATFILGRILDLQEEREAAVAQYQAALKHG